MHRTIAVSRARRTALFARTPDTTAGHSRAAHIAAILAALLDLTARLVAPTGSSRAARPRHLALLRAWERSEGRCECREAGHWHGRERCGRPLNPRMRGMEGWGGWIARGRPGRGGCEIVCWTCFVFSGMSGSNEEALAHAMSWD